MFAELGSTVSRCHFNIFILARPWSLQIRKLFFIYIDRLRTMGKANAHFCLELVFILHKIAIT